MGGVRACGNADSKEKVFGRKDYEIVGSVCCGGGMAKAQETKFPTNSEELAGNWKVTHLSVLRRGRTDKCECL